MSAPVPIRKRPRTLLTTLGMVDYQNPDHEPLMKRLRPAQYVEEVAYPTPRQQAYWSVDDLPRMVAFTLHQGSTVTSMDFHPSHPTLLLVGSSSAEITLWEVASCEKLVSKPFKVWEMTSCSLQFQAAYVKDVISVSRVAWSPDGNYLGAAFSKHLIHLYAYSGPNDLRQQLEIDAHAGGVNDLAFAYPNKQLCVLTCGDDKLIKVWDLSGRKLFNLEGHEAPVYSICSHQKENIQLRLMGRLKLGFMIIRVLKLTMMLLDVGVLQCFTVLMELDYFHVELVKMQNLSWLSGMRVKGQ